MHLAPTPEDVQNVLDVGTGTGTWAMDFADEYPSAQVIGTDLSPIQPDLYEVYRTHDIIIYGYPACLTNPAFRVPPNLHFFIEDAESNWECNHKFDFIHGRTLMGSFEDYPAFFKRCFENVKPGGYFEMQDFAFPIASDDGTVSPTTAVVDGASF